MRIWVHRYQLRPKRALSPLASRGPREGALLRIGSGFADLHPWPELGDAPLEAQLALLASGRTSPQTAASLRLAAADAAAREAGVSLFDGLTIPESHWPGPDPAEGFDTVKLKGLVTPPAGVRLRIDLNAALSARGFLEFARSLPGERVDFVEDPCPWNEGTWRELRAAAGVPLALDLAAGGSVPSGAEGAFDVVIHKPAVQAGFPRFGGEIVVTSYMDHPVGQFGAAWVAASHAVSRRCGLFTHVLYEPDPFVERVRSEGARLIAPQGTGIGFDDLLERIPWKALS